MIYSSFEYLKNLQISPSTLEDQTNGYLKL